MAGYVIGALFLAIALWRWKQNRPAVGAIEIDGVTEAELSRRPSSAATTKRIYAPRVRYTHPRTDVEEVFEPVRYSNNRYRTGERIVLILDPETDEVSRPLDRPVRETLILVLAGISLVAAQYFQG